MVVVKWELGLILIVGHLLTSIVAETLLYSVFWLNNNMVINQIKYTDYCTTSGAFCVSNGVNGGPLLLHKVVQT